MREIRIPWDAEDRLIAAGLDPAVALELIVDAALDEATHTAIAKSHISTVTIDLPFDNLERDYPHLFDGTD